jgi:hypothetical protein
VQESQGRTELSIEGEWGGDKARKSGRTRPPESVGCRGDSECGHFSELCFI